MLGSHPWPYLSLALGWNSGQGERHSVWWAGGLAIATSTHGCLKCSQHIRFTSELQTAPSKHRMTTASLCPRKTVPIQVLSQARHDDVTNHATHNARMQLASACVVVGCVRSWGFQACSIFYLLSCDTHNETMIHHK